MQTAGRWFFVFFLRMNGGRFLSDTLEKDRDTLTDKINNGIITMDKKVEDAFAFRLKTVEKNEKRVCLIKCMKKGKV